MMHEGSPHHKYHPESLGWLHRRLDAGDAISRDDVIRLLKANQESVSDPIFAQVILDALEGKLDERAVALLRPHERNARTHSKKQLKQIESSITRFGFLNPVLFDEESRIIAAAE